MSHGSSALRWAMTSIATGLIGSVGLFQISSDTARAQQGEQGAQLPPVVVQGALPTSPPKPKSSIDGGAKRVPAAKSAQPQPKAAPVMAPAPAAVEQSASKTPLNTDVVAESTSRLGITVRETPATVEVIDEQEIKTRGYRTVTEAAQGAVGVTSGDSPGDPSAFSMRGFTNSQINMLYNGIKIGPQNMTSRPMDAANLERVEILKGPASLMSGEGATGGAINFVTRQPHSLQLRFHRKGTYCAG